MGLLASDPLPAPYLLRFYPESIHHKIFLLQNGAQQLMESGVFGAELDSGRDAAGSVVKVMHRGTAFSPLARRIGNLGQRLQSLGDRLLTGFEQESGVSFVKDLLQFLFPRPHLENASPGGSQKDCTFPRERIIRDINKTITEAV